MMYVVVGFSSVQTWHKQTNKANLEFPTKSKLKIEINILHWPNVHSLFKDFKACLQGKNDKQKLQKQHNAKRQLDSELNAFDRMFKQTVFRCQLWILYKWITAFFKSLNYKLLPKELQTAHVHLQWIVILYLSESNSKLDTSKDETGGQNIFNMVKKSALRD